MEIDWFGDSWLSYAVVNATTGQLVMSDSFSTEFPTTRPTTLGAHVDAEGATSKALDELTGRFVSRLLQKTYPVSVISLSGSDVVLSQGGAAVKLGATYRAILLGSALKDPQTGQSLGRSEQDLGTIRVTRSEPNVAYGVLTTPLPQGVTFKPGLIEIRDEMGASSGQAPAADPPAGPSPTKPVPSSAPHRNPRATATDKRETADPNW